MDTAFDTPTQPNIAGRCPACGSNGTLFIGSGGYVTCSLDRCPDPGAAYDLLEAGPPTGHSKPLSGAEREERAVRLLRETRASVEYQIRTVLDQVNDVQNVNHARLPLTEALRRLTR